MDLCHLQKQVRLGALFLVRTQGMPPQGIPPQGRPVRNPFTETFTGEKQLYPGMRFEVVSLIALYKKPLLPKEVSSTSGSGRPGYVYIFDAADAFYEKVDFVHTGDRGIILSCDKFPLNFSFSTFKKIFSGKDDDSPWLSLQYNWALVMMDKTSTIGYVVTAYIKEVI